MKGLIRGVLYKFTGVTDSRTALGKYKSIITKVRLAIQSSEELKNPVINALKKKYSSAVVEDSRFDLKVTIVNETDKTAYMLVSIMPSLASNPYATVIDAMRIDFKCVVVASGGAEVYVTASTDSASLQLENPNSTNSYGAIFNPIISTIFSELEIS